MKKYLPILFLVFVLNVLTGCHVGTSGTWRNSRIDPDVKNKIDVLNKKLFDGLLSGDVAGVKSLMAPQLVEMVNTKLDTLIFTFKGAYSNKNISYDLLDEYYTKNTTTQVPNTAFPENKSSNSYKLTYTAMNEAMYVSILKTKGTNESCGILAIYGKYEDNWKLNILQIGNISILGKTSPDFYNAAQINYKNGNLIDATDDITMARQLANPFNEYLIYDNIDEMKALYNKVITEANSKYKMPFAITSIDKQPQIFSISPQYINDVNISGIFPIIRYKTEIPLTDTIALKKENDKIQKVIGSIFKGIDQNKRFIFYQAVNQLPDGKTIIKHYGFVQKLQ
jgi:hypothetical protein